MPSLCNSGGLFICGDGIPGVCLYVRWHSGGMFVCKSVGLFICKSMEMAFQTEQSVRIAVDGSILYRSVRKVGFYSISLFE